jgi:acetyl-CoA carboxylase biotin carboxylase subunit
VDTYVRAGTRIPVFYDSLICKLIVSGPDREAARTGMLAALERFKVAGIETTIPIHEQILRSEQFVSGDYSTDLVGQILG